MTTSGQKRVLILIGAAVVLCALFWAKGRTAMADFEVNHKAGQRLLDGETLYRTQDAHWQFKYSPFSALLYAPLALLPLTAAKAVWFLLVAAAIVAVVSLSVRLLTAAGPPPGRWAVLFACAVFAKFFLRELQLGQINAILTAILLAMALRMERSRDRNAAGPEVEAGLLWGLATALKPYAVIFLPYFLVRKKLRSLASGLAVIGASLAAPVFFYGFRGLGTVLGEWTGTLSKSTPALFDTQDNVSLMGMLVKWTADIPLSAILLGAATAILAALTLAAILKGNETSDPVPFEAALLMLFIPLLSPLGWDYTFLSAFPAVLLVFRSWGAFPRAFRVLLAANSAVIGLAVYDLLGRRLYASFMSASIPTVNFLIVAAALFYLRFRKAA